MFSTRSLIGTAALCLATASQALAGGVAEPTPMAPQAEPTPDWTGFYVGLEFGTITDGTDRGFGTDADFDGTLLGFFGGYRYDFGEFVVGAELDYVMGSGDYTPLDGPDAGNDLDIDYNAITRIGAEAGYDAGPALIYATAGFAALDITLFDTDFSDEGHFFGAGIDYRVTETVTLGAELLHHDFSDFEVDENDLKVTTFSINAAFLF